MEAYSRVVLTGKPEVFEAFVAPLGLWVSGPAHRARPDHFVAIFDNITERKRTESNLQQATEAIAKAEANLSALIESTDDLIGSVDVITD